MSFGLQVFGSHGSTQIDQDYQNLLRIGQGSINPATFGSGSRVYIDLPDQGIYTAQVFVRPAGDGVYVGGAMFNDGNFAASNNRMSIIANGAFDWVAFGLNGVQAIDGSGYGLQVLNGSGGLAFDSRFEPSRVQATVLVDQSPYADGFGGYNYPETYGIPGGGWGLRPWIGVNPLVRILGDTEYALMATTSGTGAISIHLAAMDGANNIQTFIPNKSFGFNPPFPGAFADIPVLRRYTD